MQEHKCSLTHVLLEGQQNVTYWAVMKQILNAVSAWHEVASIVQDQ